MDKLIKINTLFYEIVEVENLEDIDNSKQLIGATNYINQKILLYKKLSKEQKLITLRHELTHAFLWAYGIGSVCEELPLEVVCDFVGIYGEEIVRIANKYMEVLGNEN